MCPDAPLSHVTFFLLSLLKKNIYIYPNFVCTWIYLGRRKVRMQWPFPVVLTPVTRFFSLTDLTHHLYVLNSRLIPWMLFRPSENPKRLQELYKEGQHAWRSSGGTSRVRRSGYRAACSWLCCLLHKRPCGQEAAQVSLYPPWALWTAGRAPQHPIPLRQAV